MAGTRSEIVEEFERFLRSSFPDFKWELKEAVPRSNGWYRVTYLLRHKFEFQYQQGIYFIRKNEDNSWSFYRVG